jgi:antitoxin component YwqK of YwqJK toxin-antitoxin module
MAMLGSCGQHSTSTAPATTNADTLDRPPVNADGSTGTNYADRKGRKQGHWIMQNSFPEYHLPGYNDMDKVEEGDFKDNKRVGTWITYYPGGAVKGKKVYKNDSLVSDTNYLEKAK